MDKHISEPNTGHAHIIMGHAGETHRITVCDNTAAMAAAENYDVRSNEAIHQILLEHQNQDLTSIIDEDAWAVIALAFPSTQKWLMDNAAEKPRSSIYMATPKDLPPEIASERLTLLANHGGPQDLLTQRELIEILMADRGNREVNSALFTFASDQAPSWSDRYEIDLTELSEAMEDMQRYQNSLRESFSKTKSRSFAVSEQYIREYAFIIENYFPDDDQSSSLRMG